VRYLPPSLFTLDRLLQKGRRYPYYSALGWNERNKFQRWVERSQTQPPRLLFPPLHQLRLGEDLFRQADAKGKLLSLFEGQFDGCVIAFLIYRKGEVGLSHREVALFGTAHRDGIEDYTPELAFFIVGF